MDNSISKIKHFAKAERKEFYQSKYEYYRNFNRGLITVSALSYITFFISDCSIYGRFANETLLLRLAILIPLLAFWYISKRATDYRFMGVASYLMIHIIIWFTDWTTYILPDRSFASEGMMIMNLIFVCAGFSAPFGYSIIGHSFLIVDMMVANIFIQYDKFPMMIFFNLSCVVAVGFVQNTMQKVYLDHYQTNKKLARLVMHDELTGLYNRNKLREISDSDTEELNIASNIPVTFMIVDMDFFKKVNDKYGHESGDIVLKHLSKILISSVRASDCVIRWGGEEFVIILNGCEVDMGMEIAEKIRVEVMNSDNGICPVTVSIGVAEYDGGNYHLAIEKADKALYKAKTSGRNKVVVYMENE